MPPLDLTYADASSEGDTLIGGVISGAESDC